MEKKKKTQVFNGLSIIGSGQVQGLGFSSAVSAPQGFPRRVPPTAALQCGNSDVAGTNAVGEKTAWIYESLREEREERQLGFLPIRTEP